MIPLWAFIALYVAGMIQTALVAMASMSNHPLKVLLIMVAWPLDAVHTLWIMVYAWRAELRHRR